MTDQQLRLKDNPQYFPTEWEAQRYAEKRSQGSLDIGALMGLMEERTSQARAEHAASVGASMG